MNRRMVFYTVGKLLQILAVLFTVPLVCALIYHETDVALSFIGCAIFSLICGTATVLVTKPSTKTIYAREGYAIVALSWLAMSGFGSLPFVVTGDIPDYVDAFFETASGFTTTGASILKNVEAMSHGCLMWRSFTHWIGGMGVLVLIVAFLPNVSERSIHILRAEMAGPIVGKLVPRARDTAKILYSIYFVLTSLEIVMLFLGGMPLFDSIVLSFGTAGTGGFGVRADSIASYSAYSQWVIAVFMIVFGVNFNMYFLLLKRKFKAFLTNFELRCYLCVVFVSCGMIIANLIHLNIFSTLTETVRTTFFQVASIVTTTGYTTYDYNSWPILSKTVIFILMFIGACGGSTAGGLKISRLVILFKTANREIKRLVHPRSVRIVKSDGKQIDEPVVNGVSTYFIIYMVLIFIIFLLLSFDPVSYDIETNFSACVSCFNNVGPGLGLVGPTSCYAGYSIFSKLILSAAMLFGRLEIYPLLLAISPTTWIRK